MDSQPAEHATVPGRWLRLVRKDDFTRLMGAAIEASLIRRGGLAPAHARVLSADALARFGRAFGARTRRVRALTKSEVVAELERTHAELSLQRRLHSSELGELENALAYARNPARASTLSPAEEASLAQALEADLARLLTAPNARATLPLLVAREGERRRAALAGVVQRERERIDVLERRLSKLRAELASMELQLAELARRAELDGGLPSIYAAVQGLAPGESEREAKLQMLAQIRAELGAAAPRRLRRPGYFRSACGSAGSGTASSPA
ncbi:MAG: hypothetical protein EXS08_05985 [Planctomycetes bacterium]|nr:hypothetical protein [Planctomycetota bacterium]